MKAMVIFIEKKTKQKFFENPHNQKQKRHFQALPILNILSKKKKSGIVPWVGWINGWEEH